MEKGVNTFGTDKNLTEIAKSAITNNKVLKKIEEIKAFGHGEVVVKIKNGHIYRILKTEDELEG